MRFTSVLAAGTAAVLALGLTACGGGDDEGGDGAGGETEGATITMLPKNLGNPYFEASTAGAEEAAAELGATVDEVGPDTPTPDSQVPFINTAAQQGVSALVISANDPTAIGDALDEARSAGTKVVTFDSDTEPQYRDLFVNQASAEGIADKQLELISDQIGGEGEIAILSASANATNQNAWIAIMEEKLASDYPDIELVETAYGDDDDQTSFDKTAALLQSHPDLKGIVSPTTVGIAAAARYVSTSEYKGKVAVTGLGTPNQMREYVDDGTVEAFALWNPTDLGYLATEAAAALVAGDITGEEGDTFEAGRLGEYTVGADGEVLLGEPFVYDKSNIDDFDF
ncbi:rhamnose ABC transporter substrate-binding protein [Promicromonospora sp. NPDC090134]|uniref:rhamnose ABC transporter substrate-binding protein n=1 Tax=Promicromonospora sp. NPDC090134 TaxID=3364408 RepID=UPI003804B953